MRSPVSRFAYVHSDIGIKRSTFDRNSRHLTTLSAGKLYPLFVDEVLPGDTYQLDVSSLLRMSTPIHPVMDNCYLDLYAFFVPTRLTWEHWKEFMGESPVDPYVNPIEYSIPQLVAPDPQENIDDLPEYAIKPKSVADYMGIPAGTLPKEINALPFRAFGLIWNEWFRDQNLQDAIDVPRGDNNVFFTYGFESDFGEDGYITNCCEGLGLPPVNKYHDYFTSCLKEPQKGNPVPIPLSGFAPVYANSLIDISGQIPIQERAPYDVVDSDGNYADDGILGVKSSNMFISESSADLSSPVMFNNLGADLSQLEGLYATINDLRYAFQVQKFLEADNRGGSRYREILKQHFNVTSPDATQQIPEFLGGKRIPINISQVLQTSSTDSTSPQGNTAAYSLTVDTMKAFTKSFTEHGYLFVVGCIRTEHTYQQGIDRMFSRKSKFDFYFPEFANISEQPVYTRELYVPWQFNRPGSGDPDFTFESWDNIFGYQEAWAEYRYKPNRVSGEFRSSYEQSLDIWHYADDFQDTPYLSSAFVSETRNNIDRTLAVDSDVSDQFIADFYFKCKTTRAMPVTSIPGLADHH